MYFRVLNDGSLPLTYRYRVDCSGYPTGTPSGAMVMIDYSGGAVIIRHLHLNLSPSILRTWSNAVTAPAGQTRVGYVGSLSPVSVKANIPGYDHDRDECGAEGGTTDIGGICSSGPHLHQASSNGQVSDCLEASLQNDCQAQIAYDLPNRLNPIPASLTASTVLFSK